MIMLQYTTSNVKDIVLYSEKDMLEKASSYLETLDLSQDDLSYVGFKESNEEYNSVLSIFLKQRYKKQSLLICFYDNGNIGFYLKSKDNKEQISEAEFITLINSNSEPEPSLYAKF